MAQSLRDYIRSLHDRNDVWPAPPAAVPPKATASVEPLPEVRAVLWNVYGTLIRIADGELVHDHPQKFRMQVALEKTIEEFNMWNSMYRTEQQPWEYMYERWAKAMETARLTTRTDRKGDVPDTNSTRLWRTLIAELEKKEYTWEEELADDADDLAAKVAYFFHARLQGVEASPSALRALTAVGESPIRQGLFGDTQSFTLTQLLHVLEADGPVPAVGQLFEPTLLIESHREGLAKPSPTLLDVAVERLAAIDISPEETLIVGTRTTDDLGPAKRRGFRTAIYAADKLALRVTADDLRDSSAKPDRVLTDLAQIREILRIA